MDRRTKVVPGLLAAVALAGAALSARARIINVAAATSVAAADFDRNGTPDLAVGSWGRLWTYQRLAQGDVTGRSIEVGRGQGEIARVAVTAADYTGDRYADLAYSINWATIDGDDYFNRINVYKGSPAGLVQAPVHSDTQNYADSMASGDVNGDGRADVAVGNPGENIAGASRSGAVTILYGRPGGPTGAGSRLLHQDTAGVPGTAERSDQFGAAVSIANVISGPRADLAVGSPTENGTEGVVHIFPGRATGLAVGGMRAFYSTTLGVAKRSANLGDTLLP